MSPIFIFLVALGLGSALPIVSWWVRGDFDSVMLGLIGGAFITMLGYEMWMEAIRRVRWIANRDNPPPVAPPGPHWRIDPPPKYVDPPTIPDEVEPQVTDEEESPLAAEVEQAEAEVVDLEKRRSAS